MPQFDFSTYSSQIFWLLLCFSIFYSYIRFFFLPKLDGILVKRNAEVKLTQETIEHNNSQAEVNFQEARESIKKTHELANKIITEAKEKARLAEEDAIKELQTAQRNAIHEVIAKEKASFSKDVINQAAIDCSSIILKKIGMDANPKELEQILNDAKK